MRYDLTYDADTHCVVSKLHGPLHLSDLPQYIDDALLLLNQHDCMRILQDATEVDLKLSYLDFFEALKLTRDAGNICGIKRAIVVATNATLWGIYESVAVNQWQWVRVFTDLHQAKQWLMGKQSGSQQAHSGDG